MFMSLNDFLSSFNIFGSKSKFNQVTIKIKSSIFYIYLFSYCHLYA